MKRFHICFLALLVFLALGFISFSHSAAIQEAKTTAAAITAPYVADEVLVKFKTTANDIDIISAIQSVEGDIFDH